jgi:hypothetical protein
MFNETISINIGTAFINATANYNNSSNKFETTIPFVTTASGIFLGFIMIYTRFQDMRDMVQFVLLKLVKPIVSLS